MKNLVLIFFSCLTFASFAQNPKQLIDYADRLYDRSEYIGAVKFYRTAMEIDSSDMYLLYQYGNTFKHLNQLEKAAYYLEKVSKLDYGNQFPQVDFELADLYYQLEEYRYADRYYRKALRAYRRDKNSDEYKRIVQRMEAVDFAKSYTVGEEDWALTKLDKINTIDSEFSPMMMNDSTLLFASLRADSLGSDDRINDVDYFSRIYKSTRDSDSIWAEAISLSPFVNLSAWDVANPAFDAENNFLYFSKCDTTAKCEIWRSKFSSGLFQEAERLGDAINMQGSNNTQAFPARINDQDYLFFASDRNGGYGQLDIWYVTVNENGSLGNAENAGLEINSIDNEITPFYSVLENRLYFSSTWHKGFGGYDIFYSTGQPGKFKSPINASKNINSSYNDFYFSLGNDELFLTSDRKLDKNDCCCNNIYSSNYEIIPVIPLKEKGIKEITKDELDIKTPVVVTVDILNQYLPVELYFHNDFPDPNSWDTTTQSNYATLIKDYISLEQEYVSSFSSNFSGAEVEDAKNSMNEFFGKEVKNGFEKLEFFMPMLVQELEKGNSIQMTIKGYASSISGSDYNLNLTLRRIESLVNYLEDYKKGILLPYIQGTAKNGGKLQFVKLPFGDYVNPGNENLTGNLKIYSPTAARNRKIEILAITESPDGTTSIDGTSIKENPTISYNSTSYKLKVKAGDKVSPTFLLKNESGTELKIYAVDVNCECAKVEFSNKITSGGQGKISVEIDTKDLLGQKEIKLMVISNAIPNIQHLKIELLVTP